MTKEEHKKLGIKFFNKTWDYIDKKDRSSDEDLEMIHYVHASRLHWQLADGTPTNIVRGEWQVSRVYSLLGMGESALKHALACYQKTIEYEIGDFDLVFAHECLAFAYKILGNTHKMNVHLELGYEAINQVAKQGDKDYCKSELDNIKK